LIFRGFFSCKYLCVAVLAMSGVIGICLQLGILALPRRLLTDSGSAARMMLKSRLLPDVFLANSLRRAASTSMVSLRHTGQEDQAFPRSMGTFFSRILTLTAGAPLYTVHGSRFW
jgi:hypothetical protein